MSFTNSPLVSYTKISPNRTVGRNHTIDTITIHCVVGQCSVETLGNIFSPSSAQASSNYGIGYDGKIGMYVEEKDRSWCSSNAANDNRAVTIEVASDTTEPYAVNDKAYAALLDLVTDICKRNGIKKLVWSTNKNDRVNHLNGCNMTVHRDYANKSCPGTYLYERHPAIAAEVNKRLGSGNGEVISENTTTSSDNKILDFQKALISAGYSLSKYGADGIWGSETAAAAQKAQIGNGNSGTLAKFLQNMLIANGYTLPKYGADGIIGSESLAQIKAFQKASGITVDGICGINTWKKLLKV